MRVDNRLPIVSLKYVSHSKRVSTLAYRNKTKGLETTLFRFESAETRQKLTLQRQVSARVFSLHKSLNMNDRKDYVVLRRREKKSTVKI
jgi:hypothetical protein